MVYYSTISTFFSHGSRSTSLFLGIQTLHTKDGLFFSQQQYIHDLFQFTNVHTQKAINTPVTPSISLKLDDGSLSYNPTQYHQVLMPLQYLCLNQLNIIYAVNKLAQFIRHPTTTHWLANKKNSSLFQALPTMIFSCIPNLTLISISLPTLIGMSMLIVTIPFMHIYFFLSLILILSY